MISKIDWPMCMPPARRSHFRDVPARYKPLQPCAGERPHGGGASSDPGRRHDCHLYYRAGRADIHGRIFFSNQRAINLRRVEALLSRITVYPIDGEVADWYGSLKAKLLDRFGPKAKAKRRKTTLAAIGVSDNDLSVAAVAKRQGCVSVSNDRDFARIAEATDLAIET